MAKNNKKEEEYRTERDTFGDIKIKYIIFNIKKK